MDLELTDEQLELRDTVRSFLAKECPIGLVREVVEKGTRPERLWASMVELGWPALLVPESAGGVGLGFVELAVLAEEAGRTLTPGPFLATATQFVPAVLEAGSPEQQERFLGGVARGETTGTLAVAGDGGTTARRQGDDWVLTGITRYVLDGASAGEIVVAARTGEDNAEGIGLFVVPGASVAASAIDSVDGSRELADVALDEVRVTPDRVLDEPGRAGAALSRAVEQATVALALDAVGACQSIFDIALDHAKQREQFGVPIGSFQAIKHKFADMLVALEKARATAYFAALTIAEDDGRRELAVATAKAAAGDCQRLLAQEGIQIMGGIGYTWEHDMHLYVKRAKADDALFGTGVTHRARVAGMIGL